MARSTVDGEFVIAGVPPGRYTEITLTDRTAEISGMRFVAQNLPAGDYLIAAVTDLEEGQWNDPAFLAELAASDPITLTLVEGDRKVQDIRISGR